MRQAGISGMVRRRRGRTTVSVPGVRVCEDLVDRGLWRRRRTGCGSPRSPTSEPGRAGRTWSPSKTSTAAGSSAGAWPITCAPSSSPTPCRWRSRSAARCWGRSGTQTRAANRLAGLRPAGARRRDRPIDGSRGDCYDNAVADSFFGHRRNNSSTAAAGHPRPNCAPRSSSTSRSSTTAAAGTPRRHALSRRLRDRSRTGGTNLAASRPASTHTTSSLHQPRVRAPNQPVSTEAGELQGSIPTHRRTRSTTMGLADDRSAQPVSSDRVDNGYARASRRDRTRCACPRATERHRRRRSNREPRVSGPALATTSEPRTTFYSLISSRMRKSSARPVRGSRPGS